MGSGKYRHRIVIEEPIEAEPNEFNEVDLGNADNWQVFARLNAEVKPANSKENLRNGQIVHDVSHTVTFRWFPGVTEQMRIRFGERTLEIDSILNDGERNREYILLCKEAS